MADTYGYNPDGTKQYNPGSYDQWGVYMGNRAPMIAGANTSAANGFNQWTSGGSFEDWLPKYAASQLQRNRGNLAAVTAAQGTPEYRDQVAAAQRDARLIAGWGGTVGDMGIRPAKGAGLNMWNQYSGRQAGQIDDWARAQARRYYDLAQSRQTPGADAATNTGGFGTPTGGGGFTPGTGGVAPIGQSAQPAQMPMIPGTASRTLPGAPGANPGGTLAPAPTDSYMQTPRGRQARGLRGLMGPSLRGGGGG